WRRSGRSPGVPPRSRAFPPVLATDDAGTEIRASVRPFFDAPERNADIAGDCRDGFGCVPREDLELDALVEEPLHGLRGFGSDLLSEHDQPQRRDALQQVLLAWSGAGRS